jgi:hypothetical protein
MDPVSQSLPQQPVLPPGVAPVAPTTAPSRPVTLGAAADGQGQIPPAPREVHLTQLPKNSEKTAEFWVREFLDLDAELHASGDYVVTLADTERLQSFQTQAYNFAKTNFDQKKSQSEKALAELLLLERLVPPPPTEVMEEAYDKLGKTAGDLGRAEALLEQANGGFRLDAEYALDKAKRQVNDAEHGYKVALKGTDPNAVEHALNSLSEAYKKEVRALDDLNDAFANDEKRREIVRLTHEYATRPAP